MADPFNDFMNYMNKGEILGIPVVVILCLIIMVVFIIYLFITRKPRYKEYKALDLKKQIRKDFNTLYGIFHINIGKPLYMGIANIGYVKGYMPLVWNKKISISKNLKLLQKKAKTNRLDDTIDENIFKGYEKEKLNPNDELASKIKDAVEGRNPFVEDAIDAELANLKGRTYGKKKAIDIPVQMLCLKVCGKSRIKRAFSVLNIGIKYIIIEKDLLRNNIDRWIINSTSQFSLFFDIMFFSTTARNYIEDVSFRINRENELQEFANLLPREMFFANEVLKKVVSWREQANIEKEKFKGQKESAED